MLDWRLAIDDYTDCRMPIDDWRLSTSALQRRRFMIAPSGVRCKRLLGGRGVRSRDTGKKRVGGNGQHLGATVGGWRPSMPWLETSPMDQRKQFIADFHRGLQWVTGLGARFAISRKTAYKWIDRHEQNGASG